MNKQTLAAELLNRLKSEKPEFFKKLQKWVIYIAGALLLIIYGIEFFKPEFLAGNGEKIINALWYVISVLGGTALLAQATTTKPELQDDKTKTGILKNASINDLSDAKQAK